MTNRWKIIAAVMILAAIVFGRTLLWRRLIGSSANRTGAALFGIGAREPVKPEAPDLIRTGTSSPDIAADAVFIERLRNHAVLYDRNGGERFPIASLTKLMTSLLLAEKAGPLTEIPFSESAKRVGAADDKRSAVAAGDSLKAEDVEKLLLIASDNDAAYAAAEHLGQAAGGAADFRGRILHFVAMMNERAASLGLTDTHFTNPAGSDDPENYSTVRDIVTLASFILGEHPELCAISRTREAFVFGASGGRYSMVNTDSLLDEYPAIFGSKTGYEDDAKGTLLVLYQFAKDDFIAISILHSYDRLADGRKAIQ